MSNSITAAQRSNTFEGIQLLRFFAAFLVLLTHATFYVFTRIDSSVKVWDNGAQGVAIFFVISGFVMALTSRSLVGESDGYRRFMRQRLIRIVPLYWALNILKIVLFFIYPVSIFANPDLLNIIFSFLFIPSRNAVGAIETFYGVGWTLNFEMFFYVVFALALFVRVRALWFVSCILLLVSLLSLFRQDHWPAIAFLFNPIVLNFLWGVLIAEFVFAGKHVPDLFSWLMIGVSLLVIFMFPYFKALGVQYALLVAGVVFLEPVLKERIPRILIAGGNASYALYLVHPMVGVLVAIVLAKMQYKNAWGCIVNDRGR
jgi:peptidoglycan/LPS O-acetylase OafA/YrhL